MSQIRFFASFLTFLLPGSPRTPSHMGQTDPISLFPSQQSFGEDPSGCSRVGCTGDGNADDPVSIQTFSQHNTPKLLPRLALKCCLLFNCPRELIERTRGIYTYELSGSSLFFLLLPMKICVCHQCYMTVVTSYELPGMLKPESSGRHHVKRSKRSDNIFLI